MTLQISFLEFSSIRHTFLVQVSFLVSKLTLQHISGARAVALADAKEKNDR